MGQAVRGRDRGSGRRRLPESARVRTLEACPFSVCRQRIVFRSHT